MICDSCKIDKLVNDFLNNCNICYKCVYQEKLRKAAKKRILKQCNCKTCGKKIIHQKDLKKRQRTVFCSEMCAILGHKHSTKNYWCRKIPSLWIFTRKKV